jgi:predicted SAM-dependent methyltransferase
MDYKLKIKIQNAISNLPNSQKINYILQKYVTKSLPISFDEFRTKIQTVKTHYDNLKKFGKNPVIDSVYYEIGAGYDMIIPISMSLLGFPKLICVDVRKLIFTDLLNDSIKKIKELNDSEIKLSKTQEEIKFTKKNSEEIFKKYFDIFYTAPLDARNTNMKENSIDYCVTNAVLEHVPVDIMYDLLKETFRIMKKGGIMSNVIDYRDHFAYFDNKVSFYNYLTFSKEEWKKLNPDIMHQNRMRHKDYIKIINDIGFEIVKEVPALPDDNLMESLKKLKISEEFSSQYSFDEMKILGSQLVLRKP